MSRSESTLTGKIAIVTGAGRGIGRAVALAFARAGAAVAAISRTEGDLRSLADELRGAPFIWDAGDAAEERTVNAFAGRVRSEFGRVDVLVNNAGILTPKAAIHEVATNDWDESMRVNLRGPFLFMKAVLPMMLEQGWGRVLNVSSGAGRRPAPGWGAYAVSKFGVEGLSLSADAELRERGVRVFAVNPGGTRTRMRAAAYPREDPGTLPTPEDVAEFFVWLARGNEPESASVDYRDWANARRR